MANVADIIGVEELKRALKERAQDTAQGFQNGLGLGALAIERKAKELVPVDTGLLRSSIATRWAEGKGLTTVYIVGASTEYAVYVHENMDVSHPIHGDHDCGGQAKYLEAAIEMVWPHIPEIIALEILKKLVGGSSNPPPTGTGGGIHAAGSTR